ncbi:MAG: glycine dehydrogenase (aminomethyl-transferring) [Spirochaetes bacterium GWF1_51_8]|nr:MAG: glycine dehydrogenase (aminomethyl-transferring) [Spirochaetes bacterium GWF1_51_8]
MKTPLIFDASVNGRKAVTLPACDVPAVKPLPAKLLRAHDAVLPELSELDVVRHFTNLSRKNFSVDTHFYPLGSCTMKYNIKSTEKAAALDGFAGLHPFYTYIPDGGKEVQGALELVSNLEDMLSEITGMDGFTCQPMAGAHGEYAGIRMIEAYHNAKGNKKTHVIVPDTSHGTNPASAAMAGYEVITVPSRPDGEMDIEALKAAITDNAAAIMLTCPNTLGIFETGIMEIAKIAHSHDTLLYYDGANLNAILGKVRPGDVGFDVVHVNVHKTFGTPHGGGGPGAGPVGVKKSLLPFMPLPKIVKQPGGKFAVVTEDKNSIGNLAPFFGNFGVLVKAYAYILLLGKEGLIDAAEKAVLNANYIMEKLKPYFDLPYARRCMHECVFSALRQTKNGVQALDIAKYLIDREIHPPTIYFPLIVKEAMMVEPTETESKETIDSFIEIMIEAAKLAESDPSALKNAPVGASIGRPDETRAARQIDVRMSCGL